MFDLSLQDVQVARNLTDDIVAVSEAEIAAATLLVLEQAHLLVEPSGAPGFAAAFAYQGYLPANVPIVCIASGGNVTLETVFRLQKQQSSANL